MITADIIPTEEAEQRTFVQYLQLRHLKHFRVPNETYTKSRMQHYKNKVLGVSAGVPDLFVIVNGRLIAVEMKRIKGSVTSPAQIEWLKSLNDAGVPSRVCKGASAAIAFVEEVEKLHARNTIQDVV